MYDNKTIRKAIYLKKSNGDYIPFRIRLSNSNCSKIQKMINKTVQQIYYIDKETDE